MPRRSFVPGAALVATAALAAALTGCTSGSSDDSAGPDAKGGGTTTASQAAEPGRYQTLPEPCGLPSRGTLRGMLPGDDPQPQGADAEKVYDGKAEITYDTDRRVGCHWTRETSAGTRHLTLDIQRVVSYDPKVSDDDKAQKIYDGKELAAKIPAGGTGTGSASPATSTTPPATAEEKETEKGKDADSGATQGTAPQGGSVDKGEKPATDGTPGADAKPSTDGDGGKADEGDKSGTAGKDGDKSGTAGQDGGKSGTSASATPSKGSGPSAGPSASTAPRVLDDLGDAAFLDDKLVTADSGVHRDITVVFRTSNVIVTLTYDQWSTDTSMLPDSQELQDKARALAGELTDRLSE
ncbi:hypothetical protein ACFY12_15445 [Streptomyces sp. NPDC001339]|uniref:hypothetical protein n=1 Tax=Streptomyces sp. NPDC001339 TaxID=3364563 RepID=UPI00368F41FD